MVCFFCASIRSILIIVVYPVLHPRLRAWYVADVKKLLEQKVKRLAPISDCSRQTYEHMSSIYERPLSGINSNNGHVRGTWTNDDRDVDDLLYLVMRWARSLEKQRKTNDSSANAGIPGTYISVSFQELRCLRQWALDFIFAVEPRSSQLLPFMPRFSGSSALPFSFVSSST
ncbi:hypothetical protein BDR04DRAFT_1105101 [Suillus decipiens]|nr:hypothetical protein BDR04DRAFT_1105101 [Suillus decipiens]